MNCPQCGTANEDGAAFCDNCGFRLPDLETIVQPGPAPQAYPPAPPSAQPADMAPTVLAGAGATRCAQCGTSLPPGAAFCDNCGAPVGAAVPVVQQPAPPPVVQPSYQPAMPQPPASSQPVLIIQVTGAQIPLPLGKGEYLIGREDPVSNIFPDADLAPHGGEEGGVSRRHARLFQQAGGWYIEDYNTVNFTFVNNQRAQPGVPLTVHSGTELRFGRVKVTLLLQ